MPFSETYVRKANMSPNPFSPSQAIHGSIAHGVMLSSTQILDKQDVQTLSGRTITLYSSEEGTSLYQSSRDVGDIVGVSNCFAWKLQKRTTMIEISW